MLPMGLIAAVLVLLGVVVLGEAWYRLVESVLERLRRRLRRRQPPAWHPLPKGWEEDDDDRLR